MCTGADLSSVKSLSHNDLHSGQSERGSERGSRLFGKKKKRKNFKIDMD